MDEKHGGAHAALPRCGAALVGASPGPFVEMAKPPRGLRRPEELLVRERAERVDGVAAAEHGGAEGAAGGGGRGAAEAQRAPWPGGPARDCKSESEETRLGV